MDDGTGNRISANSIHDNGGKGILLARRRTTTRTAPTLTSATRNGATTTINGTLTTRERPRATSSSTS